MEQLNNKVASLARLGDFLQAFLEDSDWSITPGSFPAPIQKVIQQATAENAWFTQEMVRQALRSVVTLLKPDVLHDWISSYPLLERTYDRPLQIGVVSAGNLPLVGFHDFLSVIITGNTYLGKLSAQDRVLLPFLGGFLLGDHPVWKGKFRFSEGMLKKTDAVIATGSNNTFRYFEYYFRDVPHILRKNRNGIAVLTGRETLKDLTRLGEDVFTYFGLGCRSVSKVFHPKDYDIKVLLDAWEPFSGVLNHHKYRHNYDYYKSIYLINRETFYDNGFIILKPEPLRLASPVSVVFTEPYEDLGHLEQHLDSIKEEIQCVVASPGVIRHSIPFGHSQQPGLFDYADGIDTLEFLISLCSGQY